MTISANILILGATPASRDEVAALLGRAGLQSFAIGNSREALKEAAAQTPSAIVLEIGVEDGWSFDLVREVRFQLPRLPLILVSRVLILNACALKALEASAFFSLPEDSEKLVRQLDHARQHDCMVS